MLRWQARAQLHEVRLAFRAFQAGSVQTILQLT